MLPAPGSESLSDPKRAQNREVEGPGRRAQASVDLRAGRAPTRRPWPARGLDLQGRAQLRSAMKRLVSCIQG